MTAVMSPAEKVSLAMGGRPGAGESRTSYGQAGGGQFLVRLPLPGPGVVGDGHGKVIPDPRAGLQLPLGEIRHRSRQSEDGVRRAAVGPDPVQVAVLLGQLSSVSLKLPRDVLIGHDLPPWV